jgi:hypothetical protein
MELLHQRVKYQGIATSTVGFFRAIGGVFGTSIMATIVNQHLASGIAEKTAGLPIPPGQLAAISDPQVLLHAGNQIPSAILSMLRGVLADSIHLGFWFVVGAAVVSIVASIFVGNAKFRPDKWTEMQERQRTRIGHVEAQSSDV